MEPMKMSSNPVSSAETIAAPRLWLVLARAYASIAAYIERSFGERGFCLTDFMVLEALLHKGPLTISAIGEKILLASASMTSAIDRLEQRGLVRRTSSAEDRRVRLVELTGEGRSFIERLYEHHVDDLERIAIDLSGEERRVLYASLRTMGLAAREATASRKLAETGADSRSLREGSHEAASKPVR
ncbi:MAG TPA: MarR family transcriptional regulator [Granulicella sp.]|jgi:MarR family 2-MHQ and catechol resistance regulon transcriptional repressor|nr:MarR family transcriptional regulator [Granulicella sp.]